MTDTETNQLFNGNMSVQTVQDGHGHECSALPRPLVEECICISLADIRQLFGRLELLRAAQNARPVKFQIQGNPFSVYLLAEPHRVPNWNRQASDKEVMRLWLVCFSCRRKVRKLFTYPKFPGSSTLIMPSCRHCLGLTYQSQNCSSNKWWKEIAVPLKRLIRRRERLLASKPNAKVKAQVDLLDQSIALLRQRATPKKRTKSRNTDFYSDPAYRVRRRYRDISLLF